MEINVENLRDNFNTDCKSILKLLFEYGYSLEEIEHCNYTRKTHLGDLSTKLKDNTMIICKKAPIKH